MSVATGKAVAELWQFADTTNDGGVRFVYAPTGTGDWLRWRLATALLFAASRDNSYYCLAGVTRGNVYEGHSFKSSEHSAETGTWSESQQRTVDYEDADALADTKTFTVADATNISGSPTHIRAWTVTLNPARTFSLEFYDVGNNLLGTETIGAETSGDVQPSTWYKLSDYGAVTYVMVKLDAASTRYFVGIDWIDNTTEVDPDTAGSQMMDGPGGDTERVLLDGWADGWSDTSTELACYWTDDAGSFNADYAFGGMSHKGVDAATIAWTTQSGADAPAAWAPAQGAKSAAVDYVIMTISDAMAHEQSDLTNDRATLTGALVFDAGGVRVVMNTAVDEGTDMDIFGLFIGQMTMPRDVRKVWFYGDDAIRDCAEGNFVTCSFKAGGMRCWGGINNIVYDLLVHDITNDATYFRYAGTEDYARTLDGTAPDRTRAYINACYDASTKQIDVANGTGFTVDFSIRLADKTLALPQFARRQV